MEDYDLDVARSFGKDFGIEIAREAIMRVEESPGSQTLSSEELESAFWDEFDAIIKQPYNQTLFSTDEEWVAYQEGVDDSVTRILAKWLRKAK
jgi:hypothetical protein